jgi:hypothetical protein
MRPLHGLSARWKFMGGAHQPAVSERFGRVRYWAKLILPDYYLIGLLVGPPPPGSCCHGAAGLVWRASESRLPLPGSLACALPCCRPMTIRPE